MSEISKNTRLVLIVTLSITILKKIFSLVSIAKIALYMQDAQIVRLTLSTTFITISYLIILVAIIQKNRKVVCVGAIGLLMVRVYGFIQVMNSGTFLQQSSNVLVLVSSFLVIIACIKQFSAEVKMQYFSLLLIIAICEIGILIYMYSGSYIFIDDIIYIGLIIIEYLIAPIIVLWLLKENEKNIGTKIIF